MGTLRTLLRNQALLIFMLGHFTVDMYSGILPIFFPYFSDQFDLSNQQVGYITLAFTAAASMSQPVFGYIADRFGSRLLAVVSMAWSGTMISLVGIAPGYAAVVALAMMAGLGSGAYHPIGASNASLAIGEKGRNAALAFYTVGGTVGFALGPLFGGLVLVLIGASGTLVLLPYGFFVAVLLFRQLRKHGLGLPTRSTGSISSHQAVMWIPLVLVVSVVMLRSWAYYSALNFVPLWFDDLGHSTGFYSALVSMMIVAGAAGTMTGGALADRLGQKRVLLVSLVFSMPLLVLFAAMPGRLSLIIGPCLSFFADMSVAVTLVMAQRFLPGRVGMASGFILGLGFVTGGLGVPVTGALADRFGFSEALMVTSVLFVVAAALVSRLPRRSEMGDEDVTSASAS